MKASDHKMYPRIAGCTVIMGVLCVLIFLIPSPLETYEIETTLFVSIVGLVVFLFLTILTYRDGEYYRKIPKDSRRDEGLIDVSLLRTITSHMECPNCDGNIDLLKVKEDMTYHCDYCGADGVVEIVKMKH